MTDRTQLDAPRACWVSRHLKADDAFTAFDLDFPTVQQMGSCVLLEAPWRSLALACEILARRGGYHLVYSGQWVEDVDGYDIWMPWVEVRRAVA